MRNTINAEKAMLSFRVGRFPRPCEIPNPGREGSRHPPPQTKIAGVYGCLPHRDSLTLAPPTKGGLRSNGSSTMQIRPFTRMFSKPTRLCPLIISAIPYPGADETLGSFANVYYILRSVLPSADACDLGRQGLPKGRSIRNGLGRPRGTHGLMAVSDRWCAKCKRCDWTGARVAAKGRIKAGERARNANLRARTE